MRDYKIITTFEVYDCLLEGKFTGHFSTKVLEDLYFEQDKILTSKGYKEGFNDSVLILYNNKVFYYETLWLAIEKIFADSQGCDLIEFSDGNIGFIGYYPNNNKQISFKLLKQATLQDKRFIESFNVTPTIEEYNEKLKIK